MIRLFAAVLLAGSLLVAAPNPAEACGQWKLQDLEKDHLVDFWINTAAILKAGKKQRYILRFFDTADGLRAGRGKKARYRIAGKTLMSHKRQIGAVDPDTGEITIGKQRFDVSFTERVPRSHLRWQVEVRRGDKLVATANAMALCRSPRKPKLTPAGERAEIMARIAYYLAWRARR